VKPLTIRKSLNSLWLNLWDEQWQKLVRFRRLKCCRIRTRFAMPEKIPLWIEKINKLSSLILALHPCTTGTGIANLISDSLDFIGKKNPHRHRFPVATALREFFFPPSPIPPDRLIYSVPSKTV
jgi:hypothetical protein